MAAQHLPRDLVRLSSVLKNWLKRRRGIAHPLSSSHLLFNEAHSSEYRERGIVALFLDLQRRV